MREDMQYISGVLDELEAVVDRSDLLVMLDELRGSLPPELAEAEEIRRECGAIVAAAEEEAGRIIEDANHRADAMAPETELYRRAERRAGEVIDRAESYAEEVANGSDVYRDRVMGQLESWFHDSIVSVGESRQELNGVPANRPAPAEAAEGDDEGQDWQVSSAHPSS